jgi:F-type H+-transporting ATPase subunit delta
MTATASAARYARAVFDVALQEGADLDAIRRDLASFAALVTGNQDLHRALTNPVIPAARKRAVLDAVLAQAGGVQPIVGRTLRLLAERDRLGLVAALARAFERRLMDYRKIVRAEVRTALELPPDRIEALRQGLSRATGRDVHLETRVDASILGGAVTRIGSTVYDGSVTRQLQRLRQSLVDSAQ